MPSQTQSTISILTSLVQLAAKYQLATSGEFCISRQSNTNEIDNAAFSETDLQYVSSSRFDFDGGIEVVFCAVGELAVILQNYSVPAAFIVSIYNLHDGSELDNYLVADKEDCEFINVSSTNSLAQNTSPQLIADLDNYWNGDKIGQIRSFVALKLGL